MKADIKKDGDCRINITITAPAEETAAAYGKALSFYQKNAQIRGFRKGKAPREIILRAYGEQIESEVKQRLCLELTNKVIQNEKLDVAAIIGARDVTFAPDKGIELVAMVDVEPEFKAPKYKGLPLKYEKPSVSDDEIAKQLEMIRGSFDTTAESAEPVKDGDYANISFESDIAMPEGTEESVLRYVKNDNFWLQAGEKPAYEAIPGSSLALVGHKAGDEFTMDAVFPDDFRIEALRGKKGVYTCKLLKVNAVVHATDEAVCKGMQVGSIAEIEKLIRDRLTQEREFAERGRLHGEIDALFMKKATFEVPASKVQAAGRAVGESVVREEIQGKVERQEDVDNYIKDHSEELREKIDERAKAIVRLNYIGKALAKELDITATENDVRALANQEAAAYARRDPSITGEKIFDNIRKNGEVSYYQDRIRYSRVVDWIIDNDIKAAEK